MNTIKSFFFIIGIFAFGLFIFYFRLFFDNHVVGEKTIKVVNMNVLSEKLRDMLRKSPQTLEEIVRKVNGGNADGDKTAVHIYTKGSKLDTYHIGSSKTKNKDDNDADATNNNNKGKGKGKGVSKTVSMDKETKEKLDEKTEVKGRKKEAKTINKFPMCSEKGSNLVGALFIDQSIPKDILAVEKELSVQYGGTVEKGGRWAPTTCTPRKKVAVIIPFRKRFQQLKIFLRHLHPFLQRQEILYRIIVVEQLYDDPFNRAALFNVGFVEALKLNKEFDCFIFSDVDLLPEDDRNYYGCPNSPRHMSVAVDKFNYRLPYATIFGGVGAFAKEDFERINGFSNLFWGWGGEDDDLYGRITSVGFKLKRPSLQIGRYTMIRIHHFQSSKADPNRMNLLKNSDQRMTADGLNTLKYKLEAVDEKPLVTFVRIQLKKSMYT